MWVAHSSLDSPWFLTLSLLKLCIKYRLLSVSAILSEQVVERINGNPMSSLRDLGLDTGVTESLASELNAESEIFIKCRESGAWGQFPLRPAARVEGRFTEAHQ